MSGKALDLARVMHNKKCPASLIHLTSGDLVGNIGIISPLPPLGNSALPSEY